MKSHDYDGGIRSLVTTENLEWPLADVPSATMIGAIFNAALITLIF